MDTPDLPEPPQEEPQGSAIGVDSWVAEAAGRRAQVRGPLALAARGLRATPDPLKLLAFVVVASTLPFWLNEGDLFNFGLFTLLYAALALGLNVVVGYAGLLDLGYVAFYGIGAYTYAELSSAQYGIHWPAEASIPVAMAAAALVGLVLGFASRRLLGDYLAIVTLFFLEAFQAFTNVANPTVAGKGLTGGVNGIANLDPLDIFGYRLYSVKQQYFFLLIVVAVITTALYFVNQSRTGRAWRALREDPLAAEAMSIPVNRLKISAFALGAAIAGLAGAIFAAIFTAVIAGNFGVALLIIIYAIVILGGMGSLAGVILGAVVINVSFQFLEPQNGHADVKRYLFYGLIILFVTRLKPRWRAALVLGGTLAFGVVFHTIIDATTANSWTSGTPVAPGSHWLAVALKDWVVIPNSSHGNFNNYVYIGLVVAIVVVRSLEGWWRTAAMIPTLYLTAIVWEDVLSQSPPVTALILFGAMLVALMTVRPQGLLGTARVEIV
ncbi:MAG TPA: branched-chain amino acid ABC transporter permease [Gaiellaceae bacterium]|nr:branched-chain amino acid ABC transporter permease [Gaiellaceae bacterium]